jgi:hypothetical protein
MAATTTTPAASGGGVGVLQPETIAAIHGVIKKHTQLLPSFLVSAPQWWQHHCWADLRSRVHSSGLV